MAGWRAVTTPGDDALPLRQRRAASRPTCASTCARGNAFRAPAVMEGITALEQAMDELAIELELDPLDLRRRNFTDRDQSADLPYTSNALLYCYDRVAELAGWARPRPAARAGATTACCAAWAARRRSGGAAAGRPRTPPAASAATASRVVTIGVQDIGTGSLTTARMVRRRGARPAARPRARGRRRHAARTSTARSRAARRRRRP